MNKKDKLAWMQWHIRSAVQRMHKKYYQHPNIFLTEADVQCDLYSELIKEISKIYQLSTCDINGKNKNFINICTRMVHAEMYNIAKKKEFVDLCILDPNKFWLFVKKTKLNNNKNCIPLHGRNWNTKDTIGIEIKVNFWDSNLRRFCKSLIKDFKKLKQYKRGWLIFIDNYSLIKNKEEWREVVTKMIREANMGNLKKTLNAYYLSPENGIAFSYKSHDNSV
jgi:hypothetical protein